MYSGFWRRFGAWWLDAFIIGIFSLMVGYVLPIIGGLVLWFFYAPMLEASAIRGTIGKYLMGIQVANLNGGRVTFQAAVIRNLMKFVSALLIGFGYIMMLFTDRKQCLHDLVADTTVIYGRNEMSIWDAWVAEVKDVFGGNRAPTPVAAAPQSPVSSTITEELAKLQAMREAGQLSAEEYEAAKRKLLS